MTRLQVPVGAASLGDLEAELRHALAAADLADAASFGVEQTGDFFTVTFAGISVDAARAVLSSAASIAGAVEQVPAEEGA